MTQTGSSETKPSPTKTSNDERETFRTPTDEKDSKTEQHGSETKGCATSFIMQERGEVGGVCGEAQKETKGKYVQPDKEKEVGGEG
jgi:hypothetical protein